MTRSPLATEYAVTPEERARLAQASKTPCPGCGNVITVGDEEQFGACCDCYAAAVQDEQDRRSGEPL